MKIFQLVLLYLIYAANSYGQTVTQNSYGWIDVEITKEKKPKKIWAKVEIKSAFRGGDSALVKWLEKNLDRSLTYRNGAKKGKYTVSVKFIISKDGSVSNVQCDKDPGYGMCKEVLRVVKNLPRWSSCQKTTLVKAYRTTSQ